MFLNADGRSTETGQTVPDGGSGDWEGPAADGRQFHGRYQQTIGPRLRAVTGGLLPMSAFIIRLRCVHTTVIYCRAA